MSGVEVEKSGLARALKRLSRYIILYQHHHIFTIKYILYLIYDKCLQLSYTFTICENFLLYNI